MTQNGAALNPTRRSGARRSAAASRRAARQLQPAAAADLLPRRQGHARRDRRTSQQQPSRKGAFGFAGVDDHYFLAAALPGRAAGRASSTQPVSVPVDGDPTTGAHFVVVVGARTPAGAASARVLLRARRISTCSRRSIRDLVRAIDFGMFALLVVPLLRALKWVNGYVGNYGWSIIVLTILINLAMFPLRHKSVVSMRKMQELQPQVKAIQDRYAKLKMTDPGAPEDERRVMALYKRARRQPGQRLRADAADAAGAVRVLLDAVGGDRAARRAVRRLDPRPVGARSAASSRRC